MQLLETNKTQKRTYTPEEYLALEETAEYKNEYHDGKIIPMTGGTTNHNQIAGNFYKQFPLTICSKPFRALSPEGLTTKC